MNLKERVDLARLAEHDGQSISVAGWVAQSRSSKGLHFIVLRDGTARCQCVVAEASVSEASWAVATALTQEASVWIKGTVHRDDRQEGGYEVQVESISLIGASVDYPITPKDHGIDFLMNHRHVWLRSRRPWAMMKIRNQIISSIHAFFQEEGFVQMDAPILTGSSVEGTSTLFELDYFGSSAYLTQSGQLYGEAMALALGKIYTFGPTFRAEKSKTRRHLTEFWMIEPEMAFYDLDMNMDLAEAFLIRIVGDVLETCEEELQVLGRDLAPLQQVKGPFPRLTYTEAVELLRSDKTQEMFEAREASLLQEQAAIEAERSENQKRYGQAKKHEKRRIDAREIEINRRQEEIEEALRNLPAWKASAKSFTWGNDFGGSDETILTWHFDRPIIVHRYPAAIKAFYMKRDPEDDRVALGMDVLAPEGYGEIVGGGQRADDLGFLIDQINAHDLPQDAYEWYLDLRRYGSVPHAGFGLGLERTITWICGLHHLRETIPFPRMMGKIHP